MGMGYIIRALCPRTTDTNESISSQPSLTFILLFILSSSHNFSLSRIIRRSWRRAHLLLFILSPYSTRSATFHRLCWISRESLTSLSWIVSSWRFILVLAEKMLVSPFFHLAPTSGPISHFICPPLATIGTASPHSISRPSRCLDTSTRYHGAVIISTNKGVPYFRVYTSHDYATDL